MNPQREIPCNYTSADDRQLVSHLLGSPVWHTLEELRGRRVTGRSARLLMRFFGDILIHKRNPYLCQELIDSPRRRRRFFRSMERNLSVIEGNAGGEARVLDVIRECRRLFEGFRGEVLTAPATRRRIRKELGAIVGKEDVRFDPFTLVSHATDATDWRLHVPAAVITPSEEGQVAPLLRAIGKLGLHAIPRGAGTGLTGGCVPLRPGCVMVNTERLDRIHGIERKLIGQEGGRQLTAPVISLEAGVVTEAAMECAAARGLVFATDPTSAWASTIGGNIAENAGGKTTVLWGTAIDNVLSYRMAMPSGATWTIRRLGHPLRKILPGDTVRFEVTDEGGAVVRKVELRGEDIRKKGLWKDITNKALGGLPGIQKEGTDGVITSAEFVLYPAYEESATACLEFFGPDMDEAGKVIVEISRAFPDKGEEALRALEHFDDQYVRAIQYKVKAPRAETPKAVLLIDIVGHTREQVLRGVSTLRRILESHESTFLFEARDAEEARRFWQDRKKLGAIAARTNAFKLNEDIVLPLESLAEFARFVDALNVEEERYSQELYVRRVESSIHLAKPKEDPEWLTERIPRAVELCHRSADRIRGADESLLKSLTMVRGLQRELLELLRGDDLMAREIQSIYDDVRTRLLVIATHMHAGDGNVHVNIPVLSNDRAMMDRAEALVDKVMARVVELGGVVSGEHGIGITKLKYLEPARIEDLSAYRREVDPGGLMNPGKLSDTSVLKHVFTPSFNLLELEARILQHGSLEELAVKIAQCVRCGRCKPDCCVFHPPKGLFFHPRNKNLAIGALVEALLYDAERGHSTSFELLKYLGEVADHCTICHKCLKPCPVSIDTGKVSVLERQILAARGHKHTRAATLLTLKYLDSRSRGFNRAFRGLVLRLGGALQRKGTKLLAPLLRWKRAAKMYPLSMLGSPMPAADPGTLRDILPRCEADQVLVIEPERDVRSTVFYFPGCGSERLFSRVSMAALYVLLDVGARVVLPPPYLCCGFPAHANARTRLHDRTVLRDTILFSQIREMFSYLSFTACAVTCGTCREALEGMDAGKIFGCGIVDVARLAMEQGLEVRPSPGGKTLYHAPCHDSLDGKAAETLGKIGGYSLHAVPNCCSEAGTLALSRPDISSALLHRKAAAIREALRDLGPPGGAGPAEAAGPRVLLTNCPSCLQGLGRSAGLGIAPRHVAVELALRRGGEGWVETLRRLASRAQAVHF